MAEDVYVHPNALCESIDVGPGTRIWAFAHVMEGARVGAECNIGDHAYVESGAVIGDRVTLKNGVMIWEGVDIGPDCFIGPGVAFTNDRYPRSARGNVPAITEHYADKDNWLVPTHLGRGVSLGAGAVIAPGVVIGDYAMVTAGAVVTRDVAPFRLVIGNPARTAGWVCRAGNRLLRAGDDALRCPACQKTLALENDGQLTGGC